MTPKEKSILFAVSGCHALIHAYMLVFPTIYRRLGSALDLEFAGVGFVGMASYMAFGFGSLPSGFLADRLGARLLLVVCLAGTTLASVLAFILGSTGGVIFALILLGLFASMYHPAGLSIISTSLKDTGRAMGIHGMAGTLGVAVSPLITGMMTQRFSWQHSYIVFAAAGVGLLLVLLSSLRFHVRPSEAPRGEAEHVGLSRSLTRNLVFIYVIGAVYGLIYRGMMVFFPTYLAERIPFIGDDVQRSGYVSSAILAVGVVGALVGGHLATSTHRIGKNMLVVFALLALLSLAFYFGQGFVLIAVAAPMVLLLFGFQPLQNTLLARSSHSMQRGAVYGINHSMGFGFGAFASGIGGVLGSRYGMGSIALMMLAFCVVIIALLVFSPAVRQRRQDGVP
jgi:MFS family permease